MTAIPSTAPQNDIDDTFELMDIDEADDEDEVIDTKDDKNAFVVTPKAKIGRPSKKGKVTPYTLDRCLKLILATLSKICGDSGLDMYEVLETLGWKFNLTGGPNYDYEQGQIFDQVSKGIDPSPKEVPHRFSPIYNDCARNW